MEPARPRTPLGAYLLTLLACALIYFPRLGATGFSSTEGHRVIPAWEMLAGRDFLIPRMFGQAYLRKPPGMPWAIALSSSIFGQTEFGARLVSAVSVTLLCILIARTSARWFGPRTALWAGLAAALTPLFWTIGRTAEIEALNTLASGAAVVFLLDLLLAERERRDSSQIHPLIPALLAAAALALALFAKGPAALPAVAGAIAAACILTRSLRPLARPTLWLALAIPGALFALYVYKARAALAASHETPVLQGVSDFLWTQRQLTPSGIYKVIAMLPRALFSALPASLIPFFVFSRHVDVEVRAGSMPACAFQRAEALALTTALALILLVLLGVDNPRYAMPALGFLPLLAGYLALGVHGGFTPQRRHTVRALQPRLWLVALAAGAGFYIMWFEPRSRASSGRETGRALGRSLANGGEVVWADDLIEARPEVLLYALRCSLPVSPGFTVRWIPGLAHPPHWPRPDEWRIAMVLRDDVASAEAREYQRAGLLDLMYRQQSWQVHKYSFTLFRVAYSKNGAAQPPRPQDVSPAPSGADNR